MNDNVVEFDNVYIEYPKDAENINKAELEANLGNPSDIEEIKIPEENDIETEEEVHKKVIIENRTTKLSLEELQEKLEATQAIQTIE